MAVQCTADGCGIDLKTVTLMEDDLTTLQPCNTVSLGRISVTHPPSCLNTTIRNL